MAIVFPRPLPNNAHMTECWFQLPDDAIVYSTSGKGSKINASQIFDFLWKGNFKTPPLDRDLEPVWNAWHTSLRAGIGGLFVAYDVRRATPRAYPNAKVPADIAGGWTGIATVTALNLSGVISLSALPLAAYQFKAGDRLGLEQNGHYGYYQVLEDKTAVAGVADVVVTPFLHTGFFTAAAVCRVWRPLCQFIIGDWSEQGIVESTPIMFTGAQRL